MQITFQYCQNTGEFIQHNANVYTPTQRKRNREGPVEKRWVLSGLRAPENAA